MTVLTFFITMLEKINTNEKLRIVIAKEYQHKSTVKGFHVYKEIWNPVMGEFWTLEWNRKILRISSQSA